MNYFTHALPFLDGDPYFIAGTAVPDWMAVADRPVRVRAKLAQPVAESHSDPRVTAVARGVMQHLHDDDWFHATRGFAEVTAELTRLFRQSLGPEHPANCNFLGHIVTELLLDWTLMEQHPGRLQHYYDRLREIDAVVVQDTVNQIARGTTDRLAGLIKLFIEERFLEDYADDARLLWRLNMVMRRVKQPELPASLIEVLAAAREVDAAVVQGAVNQIARGTTDRLAGLIGLFIEERFLEDYADDARLLWRLNMVMRRVKQPELPASAVEVLAEAREIVSQHTRELLPPEHER